MTVKELLEKCKEQIDKGNGDKEIYILKDDEGNSFHKLIYEFTELTEENEEDFETNYGEELNHKEHIILG